MGYWEQIGEENRRYEEEWDRMPPWRRVLRRVGFAGLLALLTILYYAPLWLPPVIWVIR